MTRPDEELSQRCIAPILRGSRVLLRPPCQGDVPAIIDFHFRNEAHLRATDPPKPDDFYTKSYWSQRIEEIEEGHEDGAICRYFLFDPTRPERIIGKIGLSQIFRGPFQACYLGYAIDKQEQGQGKMREAGELLFAHAFDALRLHRIMANYLPTNERSGGLLRRWGFVVEGYARDYLMIDGAWRDHVLTSLTHPNWSGAA